MSIKVWCPPVYESMGKYSKIFDISYPSGEPMFKLPSGFLNPKPTSILFRWPDKNGMLELMSVLMYAATRNKDGNPVDVLTIPFFPCARQDHRTFGGDELSGVASIAGLVNSACFGTVIVTDPHSLAVELLVDRVQINSVRLCLPVLNDISYIICPDAGATKRAEEAASFYKLPILYGRKYRSQSTGKITNYAFDEDAFYLGGYNNKHGLVVDDICDGGGTFNLLADCIRNMDDDARLSLYVTHGLFTQGVDKLLEKYENIYTTDSCDNSIINRTKDPAYSGRVKVKTLFDQGE